MQAREFQNIKHFIKPGAICATEYIKRTKYYDLKTGNFKYKTDKDKGIFDFKNYSGFNMIFNDNGRELVIYYVNIIYIKEIKTKNIYAA